jgi:hypothetical protein
MKQEKEGKRKRQRKTERDGKVRCTRKAKQKQQRITLRKKYE